MAKQNPITDYAAYVALRVVVAVLRALPISVCRLGSDSLAWLVARVLKVRGRLIDSNIQLALPIASTEERLCVAEQMWRHLFLMVIEIAHTPRKIHRTTWRKWVALRGHRLVVETLLRDEPTVVISGHYGNFELGGYMMGLFGFPTHTVARPLDNRHVDRYVNDFRSKTGQYILPKQGSSDEVDRVMNAGGALTLLGDQSAGPRGCWVDFFGKPASTHKGVALFTLGYRAPTLVMGVRRMHAPLRYEITAEDFTDPNATDFRHGAVPQLTEWFTRALERIILRAPEQYWWVHNRWKGAPPKRVNRPKGVIAVASDQKMEA